MHTSLSFRASRVGNGLLACSFMLAFGANAQTPPLPSYPTIQSADANGATLLITGTNLGTASTPVVKLGGVQLLVRSGSTATSIVATVPDSIGPGSYPLWVESFVSTPWGMQGLWSYIALTLGAVGPVGPKGEKGDQGLQGIQGPKGDTGATGAAGAQGPKGDTGAAGAQGPKGDTGATGAQGVTGATGPQGPKGDTGAIGAQGPAGVAGPIGPAGPPLSSFNQLAGLPCTFNGTTGTITLAYSSSGAVTFQCSAASSGVLVITVPASVTEGDSVTAYVPARSGSTYAWNVSGGVITSAGGSSGVTSGGTNSITLTAGSPPAMVVNCTETPSGSSPISASVSVNVAAKSGMSISGTVGGTPFTNAATSFFLGTPDVVGTTVLYVFSKPVNCPDLTTAGWDKNLPIGTQTLAIKMFGTSAAVYPVVTSISPANGEAKAYYELGTTMIFASKGTITLSSITSNNLAQGSFSVDFAGSDHLSGSFRANFCAAGREP